MESELLSASNLASNSKQVDLKSFDPPSVPAPTMSKDSHPPNSNHSSHHRKLLKKMDLLLATLNGRFKWNVESALNDMKKANEDGTVVDGIKGGQDHGAPFGIMMDDEEDEEYLPVVVEL